jgi:hypothetical protein
MLANSDLFFYKLDRFHITDSNRRQDIHTRRKPADVDTFRRRCHDLPLNDPPIGIRDLQAFVPGQSFKV